MTVDTNLFLSRSCTLREALERMDQVGLGILLMIRDDASFERTVTDGDLRRLVLSGVALSDSINRLPQIESVVLQEGASRQTAIELMNKYAINHIPVLDLRRRVVAVLDRKEIDQQVFLSSPHLGSFEREYVEEAFRTNWIAPLGPNVDAFERELCSWVGVAHGAALSSGTAAIHLALCVLGVGRGDRVFCSTLTFAASANPIVYQGAEPVFIDSEPNSWNMSPIALERALHDAKREGRLPKAVIVVNIYGQSADYDLLLPICARYGVSVIEDAAESLGATYKGHASGTIGRIGVFSFNGNKIITTSGGGMLVSADESLVRRARFLSTQAREPARHYQHETIGYNYRLSNVLAGVGRGQLRVLADRVAARRRIFDRYRSGLTAVPGLTWMPEPSWSRGNRWLSVALLDPTQTKVTVDQLITKLAGERIEARPVWKPMHLQPVFRGSPYYAHGEESVSDKLFDLGLCLPSGSNMTDEQQDRVIDLLREALTSAH